MVAGKQLKAPKVQVDPQSHSQLHTENSLSLQEKDTNKSSGLAKLLQGLGIKKPL